MSASSKKKLRKEQNAASMTQRQKAEKKEAKKLKIYTATFWVVMVLCIAIVAGIALRGPVTSLVNKATTALIVGDHKLSAVELNYFYIDAINEYCNQYSSYLSYFLDTDKPIGEQTYDKETGTTWADNFLDMAIDSAQNTYGLYDAAVKAGHKLSEDEQKSMDTLYSNMNIYAAYYGYSNASQYLTAMYGDGANENNYKDYYEVTALASSYYAAYQKDLEDSYDDVKVRAYEKDKLHEYNSYTFAYHYLNVDKFKTGGTKSEDGKTTTYTDEEIAAAEKAVKEAAEALAVTENNTVEALNKAIEELEKKQAEANKKDEDKKDEGEDKKEETTKYSTCTESKDTLYKNVNAAMQEWLSNKDRKEGDIAALPHTTKSTDKDGKETETLKGYYVVIYQEVEDNSYALANVRHVLISFEGGKTDEQTGQTTYTDAEKKKAKDKAYELYDEWLYGKEKPTEETFIELAKKNSKDGNAAEGGLYEDIYPGQMVTTFNDWCFDEDRKEGDHGIVETTYGYHIMFYSGDSETTYRDYMITNDMLAEDMEKWQTAVNDATTVTKKNTGRIDRDLIVGKNSQG